MGLAEQLFPGSRATDKCRDVRAGWLLSVEHAGLRRWMLATFRSNHDLWERTSACLPRSPRPRPGSQLSSPARASDAGPSLRGPGAWRLRGLRHGEEASRPGRAAGLRPVSPRVKPEVGVRTLRGITSRAGPASSARPPPPPSRFRPFP